MSATAHEAAIEAGGATIGVVGTPLSECENKPNSRLQRLIAAEHLLVSPVPVLSYVKQEERRSRLFRPEGGRTMFALAEATIIVEAGQISGTVIQAQAALQQGRRLFILNGCFDQPGVTWPARLEAQGAVWVREFEQIVDTLRKRGVGEAAANR